MNTSNKIPPSVIDEETRIEAFLKGQLSEKEENAFMKGLQDNPKLKDKAIAIARLVKEMKQVGARQDETVKSAFLTSDVSAVEKVAADTCEKKKAKVSSLRRASMLLAMAASVALLIYIGIGYTNYRHNMGLADEYGSVFDSSSLTRGESEAADTEKKLARLFANVKEKKELDMTIHELSSLWGLSTKDTYNEYTNYSAEIGWNLAIAYLKDNNQKEAKTILEKLIVITEKRSAINTKAKELLKKL